MAKLTPCPVPSIACTLLVQADEGKDKDSKKQKTEEQSKQESKDKAAANSGEAKSQASQGDAKEEKKEGKKEAAEGLSLWICPAALCCMLVTSCLLCRECEILAATHFLSCRIKVYVSKYGIFVTIFVTMSVPRAFNLCS